MFEYSDNIKEEVNRIINLIRLPHGKIEFYGTFGSAMQKISKYPSDVDCKHYITVRNFGYNQMDRIANQLQELFQRIKGMNDIKFEHYILGIDYRFFLYFEIEDGKVSKFDPDFYRIKYKNLFDEKIITEDEYNKINNLIKDNPSIIEMTLLSSHMQNYYYIKWSLDEIIAGTKTLRGGKVITLTNILGLRKSINLYSLTAKVDEYYINFEIALKICMKNDNNEFECLYSRVEDDTNQIRSLVRNVIIKNHYFKGLKRLRSSLGNIMFDSNLSDEQKEQIHKIRTDIAKLYNQDIGKKSQSLSLLKTLYGLKDKLSEGDFTSAAKKLFCDLKQNNLHDVEIPDEMSSLNTNNIIRKVMKELEDIINKEAKNLLKQYLPFYKLFTNFNFQI